MRIILEKLPAAATRRSPLRSSPATLVAALLASVALLLGAMPALAFAPSESDLAIEPAVQTYSPYVMAYDKLDVEDRQGYSTEYIFGMSKGVMKSTLVPALKPVILLFTAPLDLAFLPFAALAGFF